MPNAKAPGNMPPVPSLRVLQFLSAVNCDYRLEDALSALELAREALTQAQEVTTELNDGLTPNTADLDDKIETALSAIARVEDEDYSITNSPRVMKKLVRLLERHDQAKK